VAGFKRDSTCLWLPKRDWSCNTHIYEHTSPTATHRLCETDNLERETVAKTFQIIRTVASMETNPLCVCASIKYPYQDAAGHGLMQRDMVHSMHESNQATRDPFKRKDDVVCMNFDGIACRCSEHIKAPSDRAGRETEMLGFPRSHFTHVCSTKMESS
jgi:hypothetical protein